MSRDPAALREHKVLLVTGQGNWALCLEEDHRRFMTFVFESVSVG